MNFTPEEAHKKLGADEYKVYQLIWKRFVACQMPPAEFDQTSETLAAQTKDGDAVFKATGRKLVFDGFMRVAGVSSADQLLPALTEGKEVHPIEIAPAQHFTPTRWLADGDTVQIGNETLHVRHCPGHTPGHVVFHAPQIDRAFVGDVLFAGSIGRTDFPQGNHQDLIDSITGRLWPMGDDTVFIPGHGPESSFGHERRSNPYVGGT